MCIGKGMLVRRGKKWPDYAMDSNDHQPLVEGLGLKDDKLDDRDFVRIELDRLMEVGCSTSHLQAALR